MADTWDREQALKAMHRDYPHLPVEWCRMTLDFVLDHPEKTADIISGEFIVPPPKDRNIISATL